MSRIHNIESLACAATKLVEISTLTTNGDMGVKANQTAKAIMEKIQELLKEDSERDRDDWRRAVLPHHLLRPFLRRDSGCFPDQSGA